MAHILVIEDEPQIRELLRRTLERAGHEVTQAEDGREGLKAQRNRPADLVVCDLFMPNMDGIEVITHLRREFPHIKVIVASGGGFDGTIDLLQAAQILGARAAFHKPYSMKEMVAAVETALNEGRV